MTCAHPTQAAIHSRAQTISRLSSDGITPPMLRELFAYNLETGEFTYKPRTVAMFESSGIVSAEARCKQWNNRCANKPAGWISVNGYRCLSFCGEQFLAHRAAIAIVTGEWPEHSVDHINGVRSDNRWKNIRSVTVAENSRNQCIRSDNTSGCVGVSLHRQTGRWTARISALGKYKHLGLFDKFEDAVLARKSAERLYGFHENHGRA